MTTAPVPSDRDSSVSDPTADFGEVPRFCDRSCRWRENVICDACCVVFAAVIPPGVACRRASFGAVGGAVAMLMVVGCGAAQPVSRPRTEAAVSATAPMPPQRLSANRLTRRRSPFALIRPGAIVPAREVDSRTFADSQHGFGLVNVPDGQTYPAATVDGGKTWRVNGPVLHVPAADGAEGVGYTGVASPHSYFAYGSSVVDVTTDGGKSWWETYLGELVLAVVAQHGRLLAVVQRQAATDSQSLRSVNWIYVSSDGGRHWQYDDLLGAPDR